MNLPLVNNSKGEPSTSVTIAWVSFIFCLVMILLGVVSEVNIGWFSAKFKMIDAGVILALLGPAFSLYGYRQWTDVKYAMTRSDPYNYGFSGYNGPFNVVQDVPSNDEK